MENGTTTGFVPSCHSPSMGWTKDEVERLVVACLLHLDWSLDAERDYTFAGLPACVIEATWSPSSRFEHTQLVLQRYCAAYGLPYCIHVRIGPEETISECLARFEEKGAEGMREEVFDNRQRTSPRWGITKAEAVEHVMRALQKHRIETMEDLRTHPRLDDVERAVRRIPGQRSGISFAYLRMLAGDKGVVKPDRMVQRFVERTMDRTVRVRDAQALVMAAAAALARFKPGVTPRALDYLIWHSERPQKSCRARCSCPANA